jgi:hypothetical protein
MRRLEMKLRLGRMACRTVRGRAHHRSVRSLEGAGGIAFGNLRAPFGDKSIETYRILRGRERGETEKKIPERLHPEDKSRSLSIRGNRKATSIIGACYGSDAA